MEELIREHCLLTLGNHIIYYSKNGEKYKFMCSECGTTWTGTYQDLKLIRTLRMCPNCFKGIRLATNTRKDYQISIYNKDNKFGYVATGVVENAELKNVNYTLMFKLVGKQGYLRGYRRIYGNYYSMNFGVDVNSNEWRKTGKNWEYYFRFTIKDGKTFDKAKTKSYKQWLTEIFDEDLREYMPLMKSNQKYLIQNNLLNEEMIKFMLQFNMNHIDLLYKYSKYINLITCRRIFNFQGLNEKAFEYCAKNIIDVGTYADYRKNCVMLGIVDKYPKDFRERDAEINRLYKQFNDEQKDIRCNELIKKIKLPNTQFKANNEKYYINPYHSSSELKNDAKTFRNCIYNNYMADYANRNTDLYRCVNAKGKLIACIEVYGGKIEQIMGKDNTRPKLYKQIRSALVEMVA